MRILFILLGLISFLPSFGQDYYFNQLSLNPAFAGAKGGLSATAILGKQFNNTGSSGIGSIGGITAGGGTSVGQLFSADGLVGNGSFGMGVQIIKSQLAYSSNTQSNVSAAYRIVGDGSNLLSIGVQGGFAFLPIYNVSTNVSTNKFTGNAGVGGLLILDNLFVSISKPMLYQQKLESINSQNISFPAPLLVYTGYSYPASDDLKINGTVLFGKQKGVNPRLDFSLRGWYQDKYSAGVLTRVGDQRNLIGFIEGQLGKFRFGYAYDSKPYGNSQQSFQTGIHQFMVRFENIGDNPTIMRYF